MTQELNLTFYHLKYDELITVLRLMAGEYNGMSDQGCRDMVHGNAFGTGAKVIAQDFSVMNGYVAITGPIPSVLFKGEEHTLSTAVLDLPELSLHDYTEEMLHDLIRRKMSEKLGWYYTAQANKAILEQREAAGRLTFAKSQLPKRAGNPSVESVNVEVQVKL
ncbi:hypothetical protein AVT69_gp351 [Pseudomonas phage PhiPA3]|uniref:Uncharacterized protein 353 n=1 Tax=Pseudomonas phage PhiPA3 TaxID=998086 RepID=F8SJN0_BPPA3|nr:hypothetical protein AVT69_gp351 [Pseudomonas phage PhiPA3]AEH03776.1 hypothetical protein [Pseudomonas phage PhiPA3]